MGRTRKAEKSYRSIEHHGSRFGFLEPVSVTGTFVFCRDDDPDHFYQLFSQ